MIPHSYRVLVRRLLSARLSLFICLASHLGSSSIVLAQLVLYDGAVGDADPVTQAWTLTLNPDPAIATATPNAVDDFVTLFVENDFLGDPVDPRDLQYELPTNLPSLQSEIGDDSYRWDLKYSLNEFVFNGFPTGTSRHTLADFRLQTGRDSGSAGYADRFFLTGADIRLASVDGIPQVRADFAYPTRFFPTFPTGSPTEYDISPNWNSLFDTNELSFNRIGNRVELSVNGDFIFSGYSNTADVSSTQVSLDDNADSQRLDMNWNRFQVGDAQPMVVSSPPPSRVLYDGAYFGGDPIKQGWSVEPLSPGLTLTPDAVNNSVNLENSGTNFRLKVENGLAKMASESTGNYYKWGITFSVDTVNHEAAQVKYVADGLRETIVIEDDLIRILPTVNLANPGAIPLEAAAGFDMIASPGETPNFTSMSDINELSMFRKGDEVYMTVNGDIVFRGIGGVDPALNKGQLAITQDLGVPDADFDIYKFEISPALEGDYDQDGDVDNDDLSLWVANFGAVLPISPSAELYKTDGNRDGVIDSADYTVWRDHLGETADFLGLSLPLSAVPEPTSCLLISISIANVLCLRRQRVNTKSPAWICS